jgi:hypothetical protein
VVSTTRLVCAERGHKWPNIDDATYFQEKADRRLRIRYVWVLRLQCERPGCGRQRIDKCMPRTLKLITRSYKGEYEKIGRVSKETLRQELVKREGKKL